MSHTRRTFLASSAVIGAGLAAGAHAEGGFCLNESGKEGVLRLSCQEGVAPGRSLNEKLDFLEEHGFEGIEPGGGNLHKRVDEFQKALSGRNIKVSAICAGFSGAPVSEFPEQRKRAMETMKVILEAAGALGSTGLIFVPAFNSQSQAGWVSARFLLIDFLQEIASHAEKVKCRLLLEPLNRTETWYVRQLADAAKICQEVNHPSICLMGDFYHMGREEACEYSAFWVLDSGCIMSISPAVLTASSRAMMKRRFPSRIPALKDIGYQDYCSFDCASRVRQGANNEETNEMNKRIEIQIVEFSKGSGKRRDRIVLKRLLSRVLRSLRKISLESPHLCDCSCGEVDCWKNNRKHGEKRQK